jgi:hypothetical protein
MASRFARLRATPNTAGPDARRLLCNDPTNIAESSATRSSAFSERGETNGEVESYEQVSFSALPTGADFINPERTPRTSTQSWTRSPPRSLRNTRAPPANNCGKRNKHHHNRLRHKNKRQYSF